MYTMMNEDEDENGQTTEITTATSTSTRRRWSGLLPQQKGEVLRAFVRSSYTQRGQRSSKTLRLHTNASGDSIYRAQVLCPVNSGNDEKTGDCEGVVDTKFIPFMEGFGKTSINLTSGAFEHNWPRSLIDCRLVISCLVCNNKEHSCAIGSKAISSTKSASKVSATNNNTSSTLATTSNVMTTTATSSLDQHHQQYVIVDCGNRRNKRDKHHCDHCHAEECFKPVLVRHNNSAEALPFFLFTVVNHHWFSRLLGYTKKLSVPNIRPSKVVMMKKKIYLKLLMVRKNGIILQHVKGIKLMKAFPLLWEESRKHIPPSQQLTHMSSALPPQFREAGLLQQNALSNEVIKEVRIQINALNAQRSASGFQIEKANSAVNDALEPTVDDVSPILQTTPGNAPHKNALHPARVALHQNLKHSPPPSTSTTTSTATASKCEKPPGRNSTMLHSSSSSLSSSSNTTQNAHTDNSPGTMLAQKTAVSSSKQLRNGTCSPACKQQPHHFSSNAVNGKRKTTLKTQSQDPNQLKKAKLAPVVKDESYVMMNHPMFFPFHPMYQYPVHMARMSPHPHQYPHNCYMPNTFGEFGPPSLLPYPMLIQGGYSSPTSTRTHAQSLSSSNQQPQQVNNAIPLAVNPYLFPPYYMFQGVVAQPEHHEPVQQSDEHKPQEQKYDPQPHPLFIPSSQGGYHFDRKWSGVVPSDSVKKQ
eukprot:m.70940 g.70940  ORF g.70940 m.70940 type:complete len:698 (+) comp11686_c0_seq1:60-2153(+)